jgi:alpha-L-rhamnosidase
MQAGYSEAAEFIAPGGDGGTPTIGANGDPSRADSYTVSGPGVITNRYIQGGERYQEISLTSAGSVKPVVSRDPVHRVRRHSPYLPGLLRVQ